MRKSIIAGLMVAVALPSFAAPATAQSRGEPRRDRQDFRQEQRDLDRGHRTGDRRDYREDLNDRNRNWGRNDWRGWRDTNRGLYARGEWRAPFRYTAFRNGGRIAPSYFASRYFVADPWRYRLPPTRGYQRWVRHYNDVLLVDTRRGVVIDVIRNFYW